jgi:hypothetical protein
LVSTQYEVDTYCPLSGIIAHFEMAIVDIARQCGPA